MKSILHVIRNVGNGGTERYLFNLINNTKEYNNIIYSYGDVTFVPKTMKKIKIITGKSPKKTGIIKNIKELKCIIKQEKIDVVYAYTFYNSGYVMLAAFLCGVKVRITHAHRSSSEQKETIKYKMYKFLSKLLIALFSTHSLACGEEAKKALFIKKKRVKMINNGIDINLYKFDEKKRNILRKEYSILSSNKVIGCVGRLDDNKNHKFLIELFYKYKNDLSNYKLYIIGDGNNKANLINLIKRYNLEQNIILLGNLNNVNELYNMFDLFVLPSKKEGLPYVLIEAQTNGLHCIVSNTVDESSNITGSISFVPLDESEWLNAIVLDDYKRNIMIDEIINKGYSIESCSNYIKSIYDSK